MNDAASQMFGSALRQPPANVAAEMAVLGSLLANNRNLEACGDLHPEHFIGEDLAPLFAEIRARIQDGRHVDGVSLKDCFDSGLLASLLASHVANNVIPEYARAIVECAARRDQIEIYRNAIDAAHGTIPPAEIAANVAKQIEAMAAGQSVNGKIPHALALGEFLASARAPEFLIDGIIQRGFLYTLTAPTFHGKTTLMIHMSLCVAIGKTFADHDTQQGRVVYFAGENPDDIAQKFRVACDFWGLDPDILPITILPGAFDLAGNLDEAMAEAAAGGPVALVCVDTSAAYRYDESEDDNQGSKLWAQNLRRFTTLNGNPAVVVPCHATKNPTRDMLQPRGGSAFLNEVDGNLTLWADLDAGVTDLHWQTKLRGPPFRPIRFDLRQHQHPTWQHRDGSPVEMAVAAPSATPLDPSARKRAAKMGRIKPSLMPWHGALVDALTVTTTPGQTTKDAWFGECVRRGLTDHPADDDDKAAREGKRGPFRAAVSHLVAAGWVGVDGATVCNLHVS